MSIYSVDKLISEARKLAADYRRATGRPLAGVSAQISQHDVARLMDLELCDPPQAGYDAIGRGDREGQKIQIKGRTIFNEKKGGQRIGQLKTELEWDSVMLVLMDENIEPTEIIEVQRENALEAINENKASNRNKRGAMSVAKFKNIGERVWTVENGIETNELWDNQE